MPRHLVVSLHDVSPRTLPAFREILDELTELGITKTSLLVIPDHHGHGHFLTDSDFCVWLKAAAARGHEIVVHGSIHLRKTRPNESWKERWITRFYTAGEGEFYDLDESTATALVKAALTDFATLGLSPRGFIAPAWLLSEPAEKALRALSLDYTVRLGGVLDLQKAGVHFPSQSLVWSVRSRWRREVSLRWNASLARRLEKCPLLRISLHPVDRAHPQIWSQIRRLLEAAQSTRETSTYAEWIDFSREFAR